MAETITDFLSDDHDRLDALLSRAAGAAGDIYLETYEAFRKGLLKHVGMEEMILLPRPQHYRQFRQPRGEDPARPRGTHGSFGPYADARYRQVDQVDLDGPQRVGGAGGRAVSGM